MTPKLIPNMGHPTLISLGWSTNFCLHQTPQESESDSTDSADSEPTDAEGDAEAPDDKTHAEDNAPAGSNNFRWQPIF